MNIEKILEMHNLAKVRWEIRALHGIDDDEYTPLLQPIEQKRLLESRNQYLNRVDFLLSLSNVKKNNYKAASNDLALMNALIGKIFKIYFEYRKPFHFLQNNQRSDLNQQEITLQRQ